MTADFLVRLVWPCLLCGMAPDAIRLLTGGRIDGIWALCLGAAVTIGILAPVVIRRRRYGTCAAKVLPVRSFNLLCKGAVIGILLNFVLLWAEKAAGQIPAESLPVSGPAAWAEGIRLVILAPAAEELAFRACGLYELRRIMAPVPAGLLMALLFGLSHGALLQGLYAGILGIFLAYEYEREGGFAASFLFHAGANAGVILYGAAVAGAFS